MASWSGVSSGSHALTAGTTHVFVDIVTLPAGVSVGNAAPSNYYGVGLVRVGFHGSYRSPVPIDAFSTLIDIPPDSDVLAWNVFPSGSVTFTEWPSGSTPPPGGFLLDTFTDVDGTALSAHTPDIGGPWGFVDNDLVIVGGTAQTGSFGDAFNFDLGLPPVSGNYTVEADITLSFPTSESAFLLARQDTGTNAYAAQMQHDGTVFLVWNLFNSLGSATFADFAIGTPFHMKLTCNGSALSVDVNGTTLITATDTLYISGPPGLGSGGGSIGDWKFDNFNATAL